MIDYTSARWANEQRVGILLLRDDGPSLFVDSGPMYEAALAGSYGVISDPVVEGISAVDARSFRDELLSASDWTQVADAPVDQAAWAAYRQALRDVPDQAGFPAEIVWPTKP